MASPHTPNQWSGSPQSITDQQRLALPPQQPIRNLDDAAGQISTLRSLLSVALTRIADLENDLEVLGTIDPVTGHSNQAGVALMIRNYLAWLQRTQQAFGIVVVVVDRLTQILERRGSDEWEEGVRAVAGQLQEKLRAVDVVGRLNNNTFAVVGARMSLQGVPVVIRRTQQAVGVSGWTCRSGAIWVAEPVPETDIWGQIERLCDTLNGKTADASPNSHNPVIQLPGHPPENNE